MEGKNNFLALLARGIDKLKGKSQKGYCLFHKNVQIYRIWGVAGGGNQDRDHATSTESMVKLTFKSRTGCLSQEAYAYFCDS